MKTKRRYFTAESPEAAGALAEDYFSRKVSEMVIEEVDDAEEGKPRLYHVFWGSNEELSNINAGFELFFEENGVYLELFHERGLGYPIDKVGLAGFIGRKNIAGLDEGALISLVSSNHGRAKIAIAQKESLIGEDITIDIAKDETEARVTLLAPEPGGPSIEPGAAKQKILLAGISHGLDEQALADLLEKRVYNEARTIAEATKPLDGEDGRIIFHFETDKKKAKPKELESGRVDYKSLDLYESVKEGQVLVTREYATEGTPGTTVKGRQISQRRGKEAVLPKGKNVLINAEKTEMRAKCTGMVEVINGSVNVSSVYNIDGDVDLTVGNVDFNGSVHIRGNVLGGHIIKATGSVIVGGVVEASEIYSGGNVEVKRGMQGMDKGRIEARGSISLLYIERGVAIAGGSVTVDASIHSSIEAGQGLYAKGKRGSIIGGQASAAVEIVANSIGSVSHMPTEIEVGAMPQKRTRLSFLEKEVERIEGEMIKLDQLDAYLTKTKGKLDAETWDKLFRSGEENRRTNSELIGEYKDEMAVLKCELESSTEGKVHVFDTVYPGARITIASDLYKVNDDIKFATFKFREGNIIWNACEIRKG